MKLLSHDLCDSGLIRTKLWLGFQRTERRRREEERETGKKMNEPGREAFI